MPPHPASTINLFLSPVPRATVSIESPESGYREEDKYYSQYHIIMGLSLGTTEHRPRPGEGQIDQCLEI